MTSTEQALLSLIRGSLFGAPVDLPSDVDWDAIYQEAQNQAVCGLVDEELSLKSVPQWQLSRYQIAANCVQILHAQKELVRLLAEHGIPSAILKGSAAAIYYPQPCIRTMGDIDIIVPQDKFNLASELMIKDRYVVVHKEDDPDARHIGYSKDGKIIELHHHFSHKDSSIEKYIVEGLKHTEEVEINGNSFPMLPSLANGLVLLEHMKSHLQSGMGLRQVIDWMMYVDKALNDEEWDAHFKQAAESVQMEALAKASARMCQIYLGLSARITWCLDADDNLCQRLMDIVLTSGNFGRKQGRGNQIETVTTAFRRDGVLHYLQYAGEHNWKAYKRHKWLKPFCWLYQIFRYGKKGIAAKRGNNLISDIDRSKERFDVLKKLNVV